MSENFLIELIITAPGSEGSSTFLVTPNQFDFLNKMASAWNNENKGHAQPCIEVKKL